MPPADGESPKGDSMKKEVPQPMNATYSAEQRALELEQLMATTTTGGNSEQSLSQSQAQPKGKPSSARFWTSFALAAAKKRLIMAKSSSQSDPAKGQVGGRGGDSMLKQRSLSEAGKQMFIDGTADGSPFNHRPPHVLQSAITQQPKFVQQPPHHHHHHQASLFMQRQPQQQDGAKPFFSDFQPQARSDGALPVAQLVQDAPTHPTSLNLGALGAKQQQGLDLQQRFELTTLAHPSMQQQQQQQEQFTAAQAAVVMQRQQQQHQQQEPQSQLQPGPQPAKALDMGLTLTLNPQLQQQQAQQPAQQQPQPMFLAQRPTALNVPLVFGAQQQLLQQQSRRRHPCASGLTSGAAVLPKAPGDHSPSYFDRASHEARRGEASRPSGDSEGDLSFQRSSCDFHRNGQRNSADEFFAFIDRNSFEARGSFNETTRSSFADRSSFLSATERSSFTGRPSAEDYALVLGGRSSGYLGRDGISTSGALNNFTANTSGGPVFAARGSMNIAPVRHVTRENPFVFDSPSRRDQVGGSQALWHRPPTLHRHSQLTSSGTHWLARAATAQTMTSLLSRATLSRCKAKGARQPQNPASYFRAACPACPLLLPVSLPPLSLPSF